MDLNLNCTATYHADYIPAEDADALFTLLQEDKNLTTLLVLEAAGQTFEMDTGKTVYLDPSLYASGKFPPGESQTPTPWPAPIAKLAARLTADLGQVYAVCVAIYYPHGDAGVTYHKDLTAFGDTSHIASFSLGAERTFSLREDATGQISNIQLAHGSLIYMGPGCQARYEHALLKDAECSEPRINLTFRMFDGAF